MRSKTLLISLVFLILVTWGCVFPFTTASYKWNIRYDKDKLAFKKNFLAKKLPADATTAMDSKLSRWRPIPIICLRTGSAST